MESHEKYALTAIIAICLTFALICHLWGVGAALVAWCGWVAVVSLVCAYDSYRRDH